MVTEGILQAYRDTDAGTEVTLTIPGYSLSEMLSRRKIVKSEIRFDDGRSISVDQRKKAYAIMGDMAMFTGYLPEEIKEWMKYLHITRTGENYFSLSDCSMDTAREFINTLMDYCLEYGIPLSEPGAMRTDDIVNYLYMCIKHKKCAICGKPGEIHHWDAVGMGNDRRRVNDSRYRKICLCRYHHTVAHQRGNKEFEKMYHVYGIA